MTGWIEQLRVLSSGFTVTGGGTALITEAVQLASHMVTWSERRSVPQNALNKSAPRDMGPTCKRNKCRLAILLLSVFLTGKLVSLGTEKGVLPRDIGVPICVKKLLTLYRSGLSEQLHILHGAPVSGEGTNNYLGTQDRVVTATEHRDRHHTSRTYLPR
jgi:hypothetical protein